MTDKEQSDKEQKERYIRERTNKGTADLAERFLSIPVDQEKAFAWLVKHLHTKGILSVDEFETMVYYARPPGQ